MVPSTKQKLKSTVRRTNKSEEPRCVRGSGTVHNATARLRFCRASEFGKTFLAINK